MGNLDEKRIVDPTEQAALMLFRIGFGIVVILLPLSAIVSRRAPVVIGPIGAIVLAVATLLSRDGLNLTHKLRNALVGPIGLVSMGLIGWAILSLVWTPFPAQAAERIFRIVGTAALTVGGVLAIPEKMRTSNLYLIACGVALGIILIGLNALSVLRGIDALAVERGTIFISLLAWPAVAHLALKKRSIESMLIAGSIGAIVIILKGPVILPALLVGSVILGGAINNRRATAAALMAGIIVLVLGAPLWAYLFSYAPPQDTALGRLLPIWADVMTKDPVRLLTGHGMDSALRNKISPLLEVLAPKSLLFEIWYELGLLGAAGLGLFLLLGVDRISRLPHGVAPFALGAFGFSLALSVMGLGTSQTWWLTALSMIIIAFAAVANRQYLAVRPTAKLMQDQ
jgi:hypothetical protein